MLSGNNKHVQQHKTSMINKECTKTQNDTPFVAFYDMRADTFVQSDEMADVGLRDCSGLFCETRGLTGKLIPNPKPYLHREKNIGFGTRTTHLAAILRITRKSSVRL